jgi:splicing factor, arginine/serine-rich 2
MSRKTFGAGGEHMD